MKTRKPHGLGIRGVVGFCLIFTLVFARFSSAQQNFDEESSFEEVATYLEAQIPSEESRKEAATWVEALSSDVFLERQQAEKKLMQSANPPIDELTKAADSADPELALRAKRLLDHAKSRPRTELHNALRWTHKNPDPRFVATVLKLAAFSKGSIERSLIHRSLQASVNDSHLAALVESSKNDLLAVRSAAVAGLSAIPDTGAADALAEMIEDEEESIRLSSSVALAERLDRRGLAPLADLLESEFSAVRMRAIHTLTRVTGEKFDFSAYGSADARAKAAKEIRDWIASKGESVKLLRGEKEDIYVGRTLVAAWPDSLHLMETDGTNVFTVGGFKYVWGCHATADGQFAVVDTRTNKAQVYDGSGKKVWEKEMLPGSPSDIKILESGNYLITISTPSKVIEVDQAGEIVWTKEFGARERPTTATRLPNGNTVINLQFAKRIVEVDAEGEEVWELKGLKNCLTAQPLKNGNILVCEMNEGKAIEYNRDGDIVWKIEGFSNACQAQRLPNGNTLVSDSKGIHEYDPEGNKITNIPVKRGRFWRY